MLTYATADELRAELGVDEAALSDEAAERLLADAEDRVDALLGPRRVDPATGRKVDPLDAAIEDWQLGKLSRATVKAAARAHSNPDLATAATHYRVKGPDFETQGPMRQDARGMVGEDAVALVAASRLSVTTTAAR